MLQASGGISSLILFFMQPSIFPGATVIFFTKDPNPYVGKLLCAGKALLFIKDSKKVRMQLSWILQMYCQNLPELLGSFCVKEPPH